MVYLEQMKRRINPLIALPLTILAAAASSVHFLARPHIFTILFLAIWTPIITRADTAKKTSSVLILPLLMLVWVNTHGAYIAGVVTGGAILAGAAWEWSQARLTREAFWRVSLSMGLSALAIFFNPAGVGIVKTSFGYIQNEYLVSHTQEYLPPNFHNPSFWPFLLLTVLVVFSFGLGKSKLRIGEGLLVTGWMIMGLYSARNIPLFAIVATPILGTALQSVMGGWKKFVEVGDRLFNIESGLAGIVWPLASVLAVIVLSVSGAFGTRNSHDPRVFPSQAMNWLETHPQSGNMFNYFNWGGYILYRGWPQYLVFIDGQTDFYGEALTREYEQVILQDKGWNIVLEKYQVEWTLLPVSTSLVEALKNSNWQVLYEDHVAVILRKP
jgi:hypothetical protein